MVLYPDVQKAAQEEIDRVIGPDCLPEHMDRNSLPHITAIMKECLRLALFSVIRTRAHHMRSGGNPLHPLVCRD